MLLALCKLLLIMERHFLTLSSFHAWMSTRVREADDLAFKAPRQDSRCSPRKIVSTVPSSRAAPLVDVLKKLQMTNTGTTVLRYACTYI